MHTSFQKFITKLSTYFNINSISIMSVGRIAEIGTVVTFEVWTGKPKTLESNIIFEAKVVKGGVRVTPKKMVQITTPQGLFLWSYFFRDLDQDMFKPFTIKWEEYETFVKDEDGWLKNTLADASKPKVRPVPGPMYTN